MTAARLKRIAALERRQPTDKAWTDPFQTIMRLWVDLQAVVAGRACWRKRPERERTDDERDALDRAVRDADRMADRLQAQRAAAEAERRRAKLERRAQRRAEAAARLAQSTAPTLVSPAQAAARRVAAAEARTQESSFIDLLSRLHT